MTRLLPLALVVAIAPVTVAGCTEDEPPPEPRRYAECLPVLERCGDCLDDCMRPYIASGGALMREQDHDVEVEEGRMGRDESRTYRRVQHCVDDDCRPVYVRDRRTLNCYGICAGPTHFPDCEVVDGECRTTWPPAPAWPTPQ